MNASHSVFLPLTLIQIYRNSTFSRDNVLEFIILTTGWAYFTCWVVSCYPQIWTNYKRKSVVGLDFNYLSLNIVGHSCYSMYNVLMYFVPSFREEYLQKTPNTTIPVFMSDVGFSVHTLAANVFTGFQCLIYERGDQSVNLAVKAFILIVFLGGSVLTVLVVLNEFSKLFYADYFSTIKLIVTVIKCTPQAWYNFQRKSTIGWSISGVNLDLAGATLSVFQLILVAYKDDDWHSFVGNFGKLGLGLLTIFFDVLFFVQHYWLYTEREAVGISACSLITSPDESTANEESSERGETAPIV